MLLKGSFNVDGTQNIFRLSKTFNNYELRLAFFEVVVFVSCLKILLFCIFNQHGRVVNTLIIFLLLKSKVVSNRKNCKHLFFCDCTEIQKNSEEFRIPENQLFIYVHCEHLTILNVNHFIILQYRSSLHS